MEQKKLQISGVPEKKLAERSASSKFRQYFGKAVIVTGVLFTLGCGGKMASNTIASLVNVPTEGVKSETNVIPDKEGPAEKKKKELKVDYIEISKLKEYRKKFVEKQGAAFEELQETKTAFGINVTVEKPLIIYGGKKALTIQVYVSLDEKKLEKGGTDAAWLGAGIYDASTGIKTGAMLIDLDNVRKAYEEKTGKKLKYVHVIVELGEDENYGEYVQLRAIAATSREKVEKGIIELDMPGALVGYTPKDGMVYEYPALLEYTCNEK